MSNVDYKCNGDGTYTGIINNKIQFIIDEKDYEKVKDINFYSSTNRQTNKTYIITRKGVSLHRILMQSKKGYEIDHKNLDTMDNRRQNLRVCTHQENQCNQPLQKNNKSGVTGVSFYHPRKKYRARIKVGQKDIHLGYYATFDDAVKARNIGMGCMFGEYGIYNKTDEVPVWIVEKVINICKRFAELSLCKAFINYVSEKEVVTDE